MTIHRWMHFVPLVLLIAGPLAADSDNARKATVMTYNIYQGSELEHALGATTPLEFVIGAATDYSNVVATNFAERARAIAAEVDAAHPDLLALQEVALWRTRFPSNPALPATDVAYDFLQMLVDALTARGLHYAPVVVRNNVDFQTPALFPFGFEDLRLTDRSAILARTDLSTADLKVSNPQQHDFVNNSVIPILGNPFTVLGGWASIDAKVRGKSFRFVTTHLDPLSPLARTAQAFELLHGPADTPMPVVLAGDFNSQTNTLAYQSIVGSGFTDAWAAVHPLSPGFTCCQVPPDTIVNPVSRLSERIDYVFTTGSHARQAVASDNGVCDVWNVTAATLAGEVPADRTPSGLWPSDHAGLAVSLQCSHN